MAAELFLVAGGSGGIGAATCMKLASRGFIPLVGFSQGKAAAEMIARRTNGAALPLDLTSDTAIDAAIENVAGRNEQLAGVVLAGSPPPSIGPFGQMERNEMDRQWQVNVAGPQRLLAGLTRHCFRKAKRGIVIGVLSKAMGDGPGTAASGMGSYVIAKYGMAGLLVALAADYPWLRVRSVAPGFTETAMLGAFDDRFLEMQRAKAPFQTPEQVAESVLLHVVQT